MERIPEQLVLEFLNEHRVSRVYLRDRITRLAELAASEDPHVAESATRALFTALVEPLADSFEPEAVSLYNRALAQIIQACRQDPRAAQLDRELNQFGLAGEADLISRAEKLRHLSRPRESIGSRAAVKRVIVLSRVTLGADVAITSVIVERMKSEFPGAEIVLVGGSKAAELFGGDPRVRFKEIGYRRAGTTIERLLTWIDLLRCIRELTDGLTPGDYLIVDPDTRLTQLGLLPVGDAFLGQTGSDPLAPDTGRLEREYLFFPSREYGSSTSQSLSELTSSWLDEVFGENATTHPRVSLSGDDIESAGRLMNLVRRESRPAVALNFGVGGNRLKRVGGDFEASLVARLIQDGAAVVLDKGAGENEAECVDALIAEVTRLRPHTGARVVEINEQSAGTLTSTNLESDVLIWNGRIGMFAALIGECDLYIGYDSAGAHIAAGLSIPCIDVFEGFRSRRFVERWRPTGEADSQIVLVDVPGGGATKDVLADVMRYATRILGAWPKGG